MANLYVFLVLSLAGLCYSSSGEQIGMLVQKTHGLMLQNDKTSDAGIFWRPWKGEIPEDAVVGGFKESRCGNYPIYMGQVYKSKNEAALLPVQIFAREKSVKSSYEGSQFEYRKDVQVLCADDPDIITWISNKDAESFNITADEDCVIGGSEKKQKYNTFFGRTTYENETIIGKVLYHTKKMSFPYYGEEITIDAYEILCYDRAVEAKKFEAMKRQELGEQTKAKEMEVEIKDVN